MQKTAIILVMSEKTQPSDFNQAGEGLIFVSFLEEPASQRLEDIKDRYASGLGEKAVWRQPEGTDHLTVCHAVTPGQGYSWDNISDYQDPANQAMKTAVSGVDPEEPRTVVLDKVEAFPGSVILRASTNSPLFDGVRTRFAVGYEYPTIEGDETRQPPVITHASLIRFKREFDLSNVKALTDEIAEEVARNPVVVDLGETGISLIREKRLFVQEFDKLDRHELPSAATPSN